MYVYIYIYMLFPYIPVINHILLYVHLELDFLAENCNQDRGLCCYSKGCWVIQRSILKKSLVDKF